MIKQIHIEATKLNACEKFTGKESLDAVIKLLFSPQGIEFCINNQFPKLEHFEQFENLEEKGIYVNKGNIELKNKETIYLVGRTDANLFYDENKTRHQVILLHGATANIVADNYAVVFVNGKASKTTKNNALIL